MTAEEMTRVAARLDALDDELATAEREGNISAQVAVLRERSQVWRTWAHRLLADGREAYPAFLASQRDTASANQLAEGVL